MRSIGFQQKETTNGTDLLTTNLQAPACMVLSTLHKVKSFADDLCLNFFPSYTKETHLEGFSVRLRSEQHLEISWIAWLWSLVEEDIMVTHWGQLSF